MSLELARRFKDRKFRMSKSTRQKVYFTPCLSSNRTIHLRPDVLKINITKSNE
jgi:hypothetical protein